MIRYLALGIAMALASITAGLAAGLLLFSEWAG